MALFKTQELFFLVFHINWLADPLTHRTQLIGRYVTFDVVSFPMLSFTSQYSVHIYSLGIHCAYILTWKITMEHCEAAYPIRFARSELCASQLSRCMCIYLLRRKLRNLESFCEPCLSAHTHRSQAKDAYPCEGLRVIILVAEITRSLFFMEYTTKAKFNK